jgi:hypothetical protein
MEKTSTSGLTKHRGSCHCGALRFEVAADLRNGASRCNCSICTKVSAVGFIVKPDAFAALSAEAELGTYAWGGRTATRFFCKHCGIHGYLRGNLPELGGDYVSINVNCLDDVDVLDLEVLYWDGRHDNWDAGPRETPWPIARAAA